MTQIVNIVDRFMTSLALMWQGNNNACSYVYIVNTQKHVRQTRFYG